MSPSDNVEQTVRIIQFSGKESDWRMWSRRFLAFAATKGYKNVLLGKDKVPDESDEIPVTEENKDKLRARKANEAGYAALMLSCADKASFGVIDKARTDKLPEGSAALAWKN